MLVLGDQRRHALAADHGGDGLGGADALRDQVRVGPAEVGHGPRGRVHWRTVREVVVEAADGSGHIAQHLLSLGQQQGVQGLKCTQQCQIKSFIINMRPPYIERSAQSWPLRPRSDNMSLGPWPDRMRLRSDIDGCSLGNRARMRVGSSGGSGVMSSVGRGVMLAMVSGVMSAVMVTMMTSGPVTEGEADKCCD